MNTDKSFVNKFIAWESKFLQAKEIEEKEKKWRQSIRSICVDLLLCYCCTIVSYPTNPGGM